MNLHSPSKSSTKINSTQILGFILIMFVFCDWPFPHVYFAKNAAYFPFNSWLSFQRLCRLLWGFPTESNSESYGQELGVVF